MIDESKFVQSHPFHIFTNPDIFDYTERDKYLIQCLKTLETMMDIDAYIIDYRNEEIVYATKGSSFFSGNRRKDLKKYGFQYFDKIILPEDIKMSAPINAKTFDFFYSLPINRRLSCYFTHDFRIRDKNNRIVLINQKVSVLDLTDDGVIRLGLCVMSYPTNEKPGNAYIKMNDNSTVYQYMSSTNKFVEVKTQKLTSKSMTLLKLASNGKTEAEIAEILGISIYTVKYHKKKIFARLGVRNTAEAIQWMNNQKRLVKRL